MITIEKFERATVLDTWVWKTHMAKVGLEYSHSVPGIDDTMLTPYDFIFRIHQGEDGYVTLEYDGIQEWIMKPCLIPRLYLVPHYDILYSTFESIAPVLNRDSSSTCYRESGVAVLHGDDVNHPLVILSTAKHDRLLMTRPLFSTTRLSALLDRFFDSHLPIDFSADMYATLNPDLKNMGTLRLKHHYWNYHEREKRVYKLDLPLDFNTDEYQRLNPDLAQMNSLELRMHYHSVGKHDRERIYKIQLPNDFNPLVYRHLNQDLLHLSDVEASKHYYLHGQYENRRYNDKFFDADIFCSKNNIDIHSVHDIYGEYLKDIRKHKHLYFEEYIDSLFIEPDKKYILLIDHDSDMLGASKFLFQLFLILSTTYADTDVIIKYCQPDEINTFDAIPNENLVCYHNDPTLLFMLYEHYKPVVMYMNSCNWAMKLVTPYIPQDIRILHSHEIFEHYLLSTTLHPDFVVSKRIALQYEQYYGYEPGIQPPILHDIPLIKSQALQKMDTLPVSPTGHMFDSNRITIGMCGGISARKNYSLFHTMACHYPQYNFLWIGGYQYTDEPNVFFVAFTENPYLYFYHCIDYFLLFSVQDPCPYVILENILLGTPIIVFDENIYFHHQGLSQYYSVDGAISFENCIYAIESFVKDKKNNESSPDRETYIYSNFSSPTTVLATIDQRVNARPS